MKIPKEIKRILPQGWTLGYPDKGGKDQYKRKLGGSSSAHPYVLDPSGEPLRDASGMPIKVSLTPHNGHSTSNDVSRIKRALKARPDYKVWGDSR